MLKINEKVSCLVPLKALSSIASLVGVSSKNKVGVLKYVAESKIECVRVTSKIRSN